MFRSVSIALAALLSVLATACSSADEPPAPAAPPPFLARSSTLEITTGIKVVASVSLPAGFMPVKTHPPMWLQNSAEIGIAGIEGGHTVVYGLSGAGWRSGRVLAAEVGPGAAIPGAIVDVAASPDGLSLATAVVSPDHNKLDVVLRELIASGPGRSIASFDGNYDSVSLSWLNSSTIALALRLHPAPPPEQPPAPEESDEPAAPPPAPPADGLQLIVVTGAASVAPLKLPCPMSVLRWSPGGGAYAVGQGDQTTPPILIDRRKSTCTKFHSAAPISVLDWDPDDASSFLFAGPDPTRTSMGLFKYNIATNNEQPVAISTGAGAFTGGGNIIAVGNQKLTYRMASEKPDLQVPAQVAISQPDQGQVQLKSLGFLSEPAMLAQSIMTYSKHVDEAAIEIFAPSKPVAWRKIVTYSMPTDSAFLVAAGPARGEVAMSWSPRGRWLAIVDGDPAVGTILTVITPPR